MTNLWSGRFAGEPDKDVFAFGRSFPFDKRLVEDDITGSLAWADAIHGAGVFSADERAKVQAALTDLLAQARTIPPLVAGDDEDVHAFVERSRSNASARPASDCIPVGARGASGVALPRIE